MKNTLKNKVFKDAFFPMIKELSNLEREYTYEVEQDPNHEANVLYLEAICLMKDAIEKAFEKNIDK